MKPAGRRSTREATVEPGPVQRVLPKHEVDEWVDRRMAAYGRDSAGVNARACLWHVFSSGRFPAVAGEEARRAYEGIAAARCIVLSNDRKLAFETCARPQHCALSDGYVFPLTLSWTMAFTHEVGWLGPGFARHPDHERLEALERAARRKDAELERARKSDWVD